MFMNGLNKNIPKFLFNRTKYVNPGCLPCLLWQISFKITCLSLMCEQRPLEAESSFGQEKNCMFAEAHGEDLQVFKKAIAAFSSSVLFCARSRCSRGGCTAAASWKSCFYSSICSYQLYSRLNVDIGKISPWYLRTWSRCVIQFPSKIESYWAFRSKSFRLCRTLCPWVNWSVAAAVQLASSSWTSGSCLHLSITHWSRGSWTPGCAFLQCTCKTERGVLAPFFVCVTLLPVKGRIWGGRTSWGGKRKVERKTHRSVNLPQLLNWEQTGVLAP